MSVRVLIVDDSPYARKIIQHHLGKVGCTVVGEAENGVQALEMFRRLKPQLVSLDVMMPVVDNLDSLTVFQTMRKEDPQVAILVVSAVPFEKTQDSFIQAGAVSYIVKPFNKFTFEKARVRLARVFPEMNQTPNRAQ